MNGPRPIDPNDRDACWLRADELAGGGADVLETMLAEGWSPPLVIGAVLRLRRRDGVMPPPAPWHHD